ncbi:type II secretion system F family protein [Alkalibacillus aidingensis]|uniref:type II secretion system F family protein n=1 Tax=Alkalibacillus aidingensis TaxID=2747607 RepID=UPI001660514E|nr:type II secretion system F family protein [Alkalibacillus aidingensis]
MHSAILKTYFKRNRLPLKKQIDFLDRLAKLLGKNYSIKQSLEFMLYDPEFYKLARSFVDFLQKGISIEDCFRQLNFQPIVVAFLYFSKTTGHLSQQIINCNNMLKTKYELQKKLQKILRYPIFLMIFSLIILFSMTLFLIPMYQTAFQSFGNAESMVWLNTIIKVFQLSITVFISIIALGVIIILIVHKQASIQTRIAFISRLPIVCSFYRLSTTAQFSYHLSSMMSNGKTIKEALSIIDNQYELPILQNYASEVITQLQDGKPLVDSFYSLTLIEKDLKLLIQRSTEQGTLVQDLNAYTSLVTASLEEKSKNLVVVIQPITYGVLGILIISIYVLAMFPMFQVINNL